MTSPRLRAALAGCLLALAGSPLQAAPVALLADPAFQRGVHLMPFRPAGAAAVPFVTRQSFRDACLPVADCRAHPAWSLQQWSTAQDIAVVAPVPVEDGRLRWDVRDAAGRIQKSLVLPAGPATAGGALLGLNGLSEFAARTPGAPPAYLPDLRAPWPHLLLSQELDSGRLSGYRSLPLSIRFRVLQDDAQAQPGFQPALHTARLVLALTVRNRQTGNFFWLTLPLHDSRPGEHGFGCRKCLAGGEDCSTPTSLDAPGTWSCPEDRVGETWWKNEKPGTGRMIFRLPMAQFVQAAGEGWSRAEGDLLPYVQAGIEAVRARHNGHRFPQDLFFYELGRFTLGWEITGFNHAEVEFQQVQLHGVAVPASRSPAFRLEENP